MEERERRTNQNLPRRLRVQADSDSGNPGSQASDGGMPLKAVKDKNIGTNTRGNVELEPSVLDVTRKVMLLVNAQTRTRSHQE